MNTIAIRKNSRTRASIAPGDRFFKKFLKKIEGSADCEAGITVNGRNQRSYHSSYLNGIAHGSGDLKLDKAHKLIAFSSVNVLVPVERPIRLAN